MFTTSIHLTVDSSGWKAVLPAAARSAGWDYLFKIQDHVVSIDRNCGPTTLEVYPNEGHTLEEAKAILAVAVYAALTDLTNFLPLTPDEHLAYLHQIIEITSLNFEPDLFSQYLQAYLVYAVECRVNHSLNKIHRKHDLSWFDEKKIQVVNAKRSLEFIPLASLTITPWEKTRRVKFCQATIEVIEAYQVKVRWINYQIGVIQADAENIAEELFDLLRSDAFSVSEAFDYTMDYLEDSQRESREIYARFSSSDREEVIETTKDAIALTPLTK
ncbi:MAG: hypothetical protein UW80_C0020G0003 [Microgenomates group bacterium GW2011_GWC1_44_9]|nr:MAG: hypothetical protein UW80_C0020G0003 [Microgenomates group bacterium GW2011_GWC1_44_9]